MVLIFVVLTLILYVVEIFYIHLLDTLLGSDSLKYLNKQQRATLNMKTKNFCCSPLRSVLIGVLRAMGLKYA